MLLFLRIALRIFITRMLFLTLSGVCRLYFSFGLEIKDFDRILKRILNPSESKKHFELLRSKLGFFYL